MQRNEQISTNLICVFGPFPQFKITIIRTSQKDFYSQLLFQCFGQSFGHFKHHIFLISIFRTNCTGIFTAVSGIHNNQVDSFIMRFLGDMQDHLPVRSAVEN